MSKFKIGDKIAAIANHSQGKFRKGDEFIVDGFTCCGGCGDPAVYVEGVNNFVSMQHSSCGASGMASRLFYSETMFEKMIGMADCIEYRLTVSIPELVELKELQNQ